MKEAATGSSAGARLAVLKDEQCAAARARMLSGDLDEATAHVRQAELIERLVRLDGDRSVRSPRAPLPSPLPFFAVTAIAACVLLVLTAWRLKVDRFADLQVSIRAQTTAAQLTLARPTTLEALRGSAVDVGRLDTLEAQISEIPAGPAGNRWVRVQGAPVEVRGLHAGQHSRLAFALPGRPAEAPTLVLRATNASGIGGDLLVRPGATVSAGAGHDPAEFDGTLIGDTLDVVSFGCDDCADVPFRMDLRGADPFVLGNVPVSQFATAEEHAQPDGTVYFTSGLRAGSVRLLDVERTDTIELGDNLTLNIVDARRFQLGRSAGSDSLSFVFEGTVNGIALGPVGAERNLSPSLLEFFYRQKALGLFWGASVFLWGLFMGIRKAWRGASS